MLVLVAEGVTRLPPPSSGEQEGYDRLHVRVIRRPPEYARGVNVFQLIQRPSHEWVSATDMDALAEHSRPHLVAPGSA